MKSSKNNRGTFDMSDSNIYHVKGGELPKVSSEDVHKAADDAGVSWDNDEAFMVFSEKITGKSFHQGSANRMSKQEMKEHDEITDVINKKKQSILSKGGGMAKTNNYNTTSGHILETIYYSTAIVIMCIFLKKLN